MAQPDSDIESMIVPTTWDDRDNDIVVQALMDEAMGFENKDDLD